MAFRKASILVSFAAILVAGGLGSAHAEEVNSEGVDPEWPAGISPLDSLSFWSDDDASANAVGVGDLNGCCMPKTWSGRLFTEVRREGGRPRGRTLRFLDVAFVDQTNKRIAQDVTVPHLGRNATKFSSILLFGNSSATLYTFSKTAKKCAKKELKGAQFRPQCLPANATQRGSFSLGAGSGALKTQTWGFLYRDRRVNVAANVILTPGNCIPVLAAAKVFSQPRMSYENDPEKKRPQVTNIGTLYTDIKSSISDPSVFTPPSYCNKTEDVTLSFDPDVDFTTIIERFVAVP